MPSVAGSGAVSQLEHQRELVLVIGVFPPSHGFMALDRAGIGAGGSLNASDHAAQSILKMFLKGKVARLFPENGEFAPPLVPDPVIALVALAEMRSLKSFLKNVFVLSSGLSAFFDKASRTRNRVYMPSGTLPGRGYGTRIGLCACRGRVPAHESGGAGWGSAADSSNHLRQDAASEALWKISFESIVATTYVHKRILKIFE